MSGDCCSIDIIKEKLSNDEYLVKLSLTYGNQSHFKKELFVINNKQLIIDPFDKLGIVKRAAIPAQAVDRIT